MKPEENRARETPRSTPDDQLPDEQTGLPGFRTWRGVYLFVLVVFTAYVLALTALTVAFHE
jgi:hypothetical protein